MDIKEIFQAVSIEDGADIEVSGWLVDRSDGLFILGDHFPEDYDYPCRIKVVNENVIYPILQQIPSLGGGRSLLFYKAIIKGKLIKGAELGMLANQIFVQHDRNSCEFHEVRFNKHEIDKLVENFGEYKFNRAREPMRDWLDDYDGE